MAQTRKAEPNYFPLEQRGDTYSGEVIAMNEDTRETTLIYTEDDVPQTFVGGLVKDCKVRNKDGSERKVEMTELIGMRVKAYYIFKSELDDNGVEAETMEVVKIRFLPEDK